MNSFQHVTESKPFFPIDWKYFFYATKKTLFYADDVKIRWLMAMASCGWALDLLRHPETLERPFYVLMKFLAPWWMWAILFALHGVGAMWRIYERRERKGWAMAVNGLGVFVWGLSTGAQNISAGHLVASTSLEFFACMFLFGSFVTSGWSSKSTTA